MTRFSGILASFLVCCPAISAQELPKAELAKKAHEVLKANCYRCHGQDGAVEGGMNYVLDAKGLVSRGKIIPGEPQKSRLFKRLVSEDDSMPPEGEMPRPSKDDIAVIKKWIEAGAPEAVPSGKREFLSNDEIVKLIHEDLMKQEERDRKFVRYFTITHLYNAGLPDDQMKTYRHGLSKLANSLSWGRRIANPQAIDRAQTILRIDMRQFQWDNDVWKTILSKYPYAIIPSSALMKEVTKVTDCELPYVRADWFVFAASRPPLYHDVLKIPTTDKELEKLLRVDVEKNQKELQVARAAFNASGVSKNNRLIERHDSSYGAYWKSYDFGGNVGRQNLFAHPIGPGGAESNFKHDGGEIIFSLPNGLQGYLLVDAKGARIDKGPIAIVSDPNQSDRSVVNGISCMTCHYGGMISKGDQVREHVQKNKAAFANEELDQISALYPPRERFEELLKEDAERFRKAAEKANATITKSEQVSILSKRFEEELDLNVVAAELGLKVDQILAGLERSPKLARVFGALKVDGGTIQRDTFVSEFNSAIDELNLGKINPKIVLMERMPGEEIEVEIVKGVRMRFCWVPPGKATLGSPMTEKGRSATYDVKEKDFTTDGFWLGKYEVTQGEWGTMMSVNPSRFKSSDKQLKKDGIKDTSRFPVENVSWDDCTEFLKKLNDKVTIPATMGKGRFSLPTDSQWEYACRGGKGNKRAFYFGDELNGKQANCDGNEPYGITTKGPFLERTTAVGSYEKIAPHPWGLCDMHGNVQEWCDYRFVRGGGWNDYAEHCRAARRLVNYEGIDIGDFGFRVSVVPSSP